MTKRCTIGVLRTMIALLMLCAAGVATAADEDTATAAPPSKWHFDVFPYAWTLGVFGSLDVKGNTVDIDVTTADILRILFHGNGFAAAGYFEVGYDRFSVFTDTIGGYLEASVTERVPTQLCTIDVSARDKIKLVIGDVGLGYQLGQWTLPGLHRPISLGVYTGSRYAWIFDKLHARAGAVGGVQRSAAVSETISWADPLVGLRWSVPVAEWASIDFRGDIGGFHASSNLTWGLVGLGRVWLPWKPFSTDPYVAAGYRVVAWDRPNDNLDLQLRGPMIGLGFTF
jgi:hypothetical protein